MKRVGVVIGVMAFGAIIFVSAGSAIVASGVAAGDPVKGKVVYAAQKCSTCHIPGSSSKIGPDLSNIGAKRDAAWLAKYLVTPTVLDPKNKPKIPMPATKAKGQDLEDLIAYLLTLKK